MKHQAIQAPEKSSERFAGAGGRKDERVFAAGNCGPAQPLGRSRSLEDSAKPLRRHRMEECQCDLLPLLSSLPRASPSISQMSISRAQPCRANVV